jgi:hypothetical protein
MQAALALRNPQTTTVPIASANYVTAAGDAVLWDSARAKELFSDLNTTGRCPRTCCPAPTSPPNNRLLRGRGRFR